MNEGKPLFENEKTLTIDKKGIVKDIKERINNVFNAFNEFLWNSIDAESKNIKINIQVERSNLKKLEISDDGKGIDKEKIQAGQLIREYKNSEKEQEKNHSLPHGNNGNGRFAFILFSNGLKWETIYEQGGKKYSYYIQIKNNSLNKYSFNEVKETNEKTGTKTIFEINNDTNRLLSFNQAINFDDLEKNIVLEFYKIKKEVILDCSKLLKKRGL